MDDVKKSLVYRLILFFYNRIVNFRRKLAKAAIELQFLMYKMEFGERDSDIYVISYPKSGTTMLQMVLYQLTTSGEMDFEHIDDVAPWIRNEAFENRNPRELKSPRIIKSHDPYSSFEHTKGRYIFIMRDGRDVAVSQYHQEKNYKKPELKFPEFMDSFFEKGKNNWFTFHREWLVNKKSRNILYLTYEELNNNKSKAIQKIGAFCNLKLEKATVERAIERSGFEFMKQHEDKFGLKPTKKPEKVYDQFIRRGKSGDWKDYLSMEQQEKFSTEFNKHLASILRKKND